jgi:hypothetical protein
MQRALLVEHLVDVCLEVREMPKVFGAKFKHLAAALHPPEFFSETMCNARRPTAPLYQMPVQFHQL